MRRRSGFTLTELLIVIAILLLLSTLALAVYNSGRSSDRMRSAARVAQSALLGAKDRALHAKDLRGVRLTRDANGPTFANGIPALVNGFVYLQPIPIQSVGNLTGQPVTSSVQVSDAPPAGTTPTMVTISSKGNSAAFMTQDAVGLWPRFMMQVRIPSGSSGAPGQWYQLAPNPYATNPNYWVSNDPNTAGSIDLFLQTPYAGGVTPASDPNMSIDIKLGNEVLPFHEPITLSSGCVIDLRYSSPAVQLLAGTSLASGSPAPYIDIMFTPRGSVSGWTGALGAMYFCLRDIQDATADQPMNTVPPWSPAVKGDCLILALNPQTGLVQTYEADLVSGNLFSFAQAGRAAGR